jgi:RNA ligase (TIGR02306 family)
MSEFKCEVVRVKIVPHPNADKIEIAMIGDFQSIVKKGQFKDGDLAVYIPEQSVIPVWLLKEMGFWDEFGQRGMLNGAARNRVKAIKLRGVLSQGIVYQCLALGGNGNNCTFFVKEHGHLPASEGDDVASALGITKYEPPLPSHMTGRAIGVDFGATHNYDLDNLKKTPNMFEDGELVVITEKIHGTFLMVSVVPTTDGNEEYYRGRVVLSSKGLGAKGIILDHNDETNLYAQTAKKHGLLDGMLEQYGDVADAHKQPVIVFGEVFGKTLSGAGVQDLTYTDVQLDYRAFDICVGNRGSEKFLDAMSFAQACQNLKVNPVPVVYRGPYSKEIVLSHTDGNTILSDKVQIREGVVVKSTTEARHPSYGRKIAKSVSEAYLLRSGNTSEFN